GEEGLQGECDIVVLSQKEYRPFAEQMSPSGAEPLSTFDTYAVVEAVTGVLKETDPIGRSFAGLQLEVHHAGGLPPTLGDPVNLRSLRRVVRLIAQLSLAQCLRGGKLVFN